MKTVENVKTFYVMSLKPAVVIPIGVRHWPRSLSPRWW